MPTTKEEALLTLQLRSVDEDAGYKTPCRVWVGAKVGIRKGYGTIRYQGKIVKTHWLSWFLHHGPVTKGMEVCHLCDNSICFRGDHLTVGTHQQNMAEAGARGRIGTVCGEDHYAHKLTVPQVQQIRTVFKEGSAKGLALEFGISPAMVFRIVRRKNWKSVA